MRTAWLNLRHSPPERWAIFEAGLRRLGFAVQRGFTPDPKPGDALVTWNRMPNVDRYCSRYGRVLVAENAAWGNDFAGRRWVSLARDYHNTAGCTPYGGPERWDALGAEFGPWRSFEDSCARPVVLAQRGIGSPPTIMPSTWAQDAARRHGARIRWHPGRRVEIVPLEQDLFNVRGVVTWGSGAAIKALVWGIPVVSEMPNWIGYQDNTDSGRLAMFRRLAWAQVEHREIESGEAIERLLT